MNLQLGDTQAIIAEGKKRGVLRNQLAYILATAYHETAFKMKPIAEMGGEKYLKSKKYYPWYGRGYVQLTWESNYKLYGIENADDAMKPEVAMFVLFDGMLLGKFTGKRLDTYVNLEKSNYASARQVVNKLDKFEVIAKYAREYEKDLKAIGYGEEVSSKETGAVALLKIILELIQKFLGK